MEVTQNCVGYLNIQTSLVFGVVLLLAFLYRQTRRRKGLPPGPPAIPVLGSLPFLGTRDLRQALLNMRERYGDLVTIQLGMRDAVILNSYDVIKDAFVNHSNAFSGRPRDVPLFIEFNKGYGIAFSEGEVWREQRKFAHGVLRDFGVGRSLLEDRIMEEIDHLLDSMQQNANVPYNMSTIIHNAVSNIICSIVFGKRYEYGDPAFHDQLKIMEVAFKSVGQNNPVMSIPWLMYLPGDLFGVKYFLNRWKSLLKQFQDQVDMHQANKTPGQVQDFIDAYIHQMDKEKENANTSFHNEQLLYVIGNMFNAGTETTATTLRWAFIHLLHNPDIQAKVHEEIQEVLGERRPTMRDKVNMPFTEATLMEAQRLGDILPLSVPHCTTNDVSFHGYHIPKGMMIIPNLSSVHQDPKIWENPNKFDPTRFIGPDGKAEKNEQLVPYSMGKRVCLGESMARMELFLFFTSILQKFTIQMPPGRPLPDLHGILGITYSPNQYEVVLAPRI